MSRQCTDEPWRCPGVTRRSFLADTGMGFTGLALGAMLAREGACAPPALTRAPRPARCAQGEGGHLDLPLRRASATSRASTPSPS